MMKAHVVVKDSVITKPLLAARIEDNKLEDLKFPVGLTNKIDGLRCLMIDGNAVSRTFKPLPNKHIRETLEKYIPNGMDMEITSGTNFQEATGNIMREAGESQFHVSVIDYVPGSLDEPYSERIKAAVVYAHKHWTAAPFTWEILSPTIAKSVADIDAYEEKALAAGHEGVMIRDMNARYKCGRSSFKEGILIKLKRFSSMEAKVLSMEPLMHNGNVAEKDAFGRTKRSTAKDGLVAAESMGKLVVTGVNGDYKGVKFEVGSGYTMEQREEIWENKERYIGEIMTVTYFPQGCKDLPRFPVFHGWRSSDDM